ncbi:CLUMA_CG001158, isoform A [Clunio marinus]|uniref:CLUMA_CG001158, isoform A n=1 Tax=Clunio marinus TaxID=568069 RepID=A0A1J1HIX7_9DIPT|nr:CLUMA_CG001158, isoform A [Clunio marinus]
MRRYQLTNQFEKNFCVMEFYQGFNIALQHQRLRFGSSEIYNEALDGNLFIDKVKFSRQCFRLRRITPQRDLFSSFT